MLDIKRIRHEYDTVEKLLAKRNNDFELDRVIELDDKRKEILSVSEKLRHQQKEESKKIPQLKKAGKHEEAQKVIDEMSNLSNQVKEMTDNVKDVEEEIEAILLGIPNVPHPSTPDGVDEEDNKLVKTWNEPTTFGFDPKAHWDLGKALDIIDNERAAKIAGARFYMMKKAGARLERALINFMLNEHTENHNFEEIVPPFMANRASMTGTGQLPKFESDMFHIKEKDLFLIPTAEVPVTNIYQDEILDIEQFPIYHTAYTPCFRREAGSAGRDTRGLIRLHQFNKVELVKFATKETSYDELETLLQAAETILQKLELPYRVVQLCGGDLTFSSAKTYDIEVWMPSYDEYLEISSCSNFEDYQARRANIRYRDAEGNVQFAHTLNGSGLAVGRTVAAILENYQQEDGSIKVPEILVPYMGGKTVIK